MSKLKLLLEIAFRNLFSSTMNLIIGLIILAGTVLVIVGSSLIDSVDSAMSRSIIGSAAGHIQVYSAKSKDDVAVFGAMGGEADLAPVEDFAKIKKTLETVPNVKTVVPMGINGAFITSGNTIDLTLEKLRDIYRKSPGGRPQGVAAQDAESLKRHVRHMVGLLQSDLQRMKVLGTSESIEPESVEALAKASSDPFWADFDRDPLNALEFLENAIAPLAADSDLLYLHYVGTDLDQFQKSFDRMRIVEGTPVPSGHRGMLLSKFFYEEYLKLKSARRMDRLKEALVDKKKSIDKDPDLQRLVKENQTQTREILYQLDERRTQEAVTRLQKALHSSESDPAKLLALLFTTDDANFQQRYDIFYQQLAPLLDLYRLRIGDSLVINAFTHGGYVQSVAVKVYGTFEFSGLEKSPVAGGLNLMDLISFRELYGYLGADKLQEIEQIKKDAGAKMIDRASAEADLFGGGKQVVAEATPGVIDEGKLLSGTARALREKELSDRMYSKEDLQRGVVLSSAVILKDPKQLNATMKEIEAAAQRDGLNLKVVSWQKASGLIGQFVLVAKLVLYFAVLVIFVVVLVIMNNAMMMATLQRVQEIGTLRAIGAGRGFILDMVLLETLLLGLIFGTTGAAIGTGIMQWLSSHGLAATTDVLYFFFSGPRLYPTLGLSNLVAAFVIIILVSAISTFYPAFLATRVSPVQAMQTEE